MLVAFLFSVLLWFRFFHCYFFYLAEEVLSKDKVVQLFICR